jgi:hypothetical protein
LNIDSRWASVLRRGIWAQCAPADRQKRGKLNTLDAQG